MHMETNPSHKTYNAIKFSQLSIPQIPRPKEVSYGTPT